MEESIVDRLTTGKIEENVDMLKVNPKYNNLIHKFATKRFTEKYKTSLSEDQKLLLTRYAASLLSESDKSFKVYLLSEVEKIKESLSSVKNDEIAKDHQLMARIAEGKEKLINESFTDVVNDEKIVKLLQFMALAQEVR